MNGPEHSLKKFKGFFKSLYPSLCLFANSYLQDENLSKDVVQEVFIKVWEKKIDFETSAASKSYMYTSVRNKCLDILRSSRMRLTDTSIEVEQVELKDSESYFFKELLAAETSVMVQEAIAKLPSKCAAIISLSMKDYSNEDIAEELSLSVNTIKTQKKIGYKKLREILEKFR